MFYCETWSCIYSKIDQLISGVDARDVLVCFDIDMTLTQPDHPAVYVPNILKYSPIYKQIFQGLPPQIKDCVATLSTQTVPQKLVEEKSIQFIDALQKKGVRVIAFTATLTGEIEAQGLTKPMEDLRFETLSQFDLHFENAFPQNEIILENIPLYHNHYPIFFKGILSSNGEGGPHNKGSVLISFLGETHFFPKIIVLVDDKKKNLEDVKVSLATYYPHIQFVGIEYQGAYGYCAKDISSGDFETFWQDLAHKAILSDHPV
jgi:hypothetical protein